MPESLSLLVSTGNYVYLNLLMQITLLALVAIVVSTCFRYSAVVRYTVLYSSLLALTLLCASSLFLQSRDIGFLRINLDTSASYLDGLLPRFEESTLGAAELDISSAYANPIDYEQLHPSDESLLSRAGSRRLLSELPWQRFFQMIWLGGFLVASLGLLRSLHNANKITRRSSSLTERERRLYRSMSGEGQFEASELLCRVSHEISTPVLVGITKPILLVPPRFFDRFDDSDIRAVLMHEVAHVLRKDSIFNLLQKVILSIFWFHPLVHRMDKLISRAREEICDNYVLSEARAVDYGEVLLRLNANFESIASHQRATSRPDVVLGMFSHDWKLEQRISDLLNQKREKHMYLPTRAKTSMNVVIVSGALAISACQVGAQTTSNAAVDPVQQSAPLSRENSQENEARTAGSLGPEIMRIISQVQELMSPTDDVEADLEGAKNLLDTLAAERLERMNDFEKATLYNFYTNYYLSMEDYEAAANTFETILQIETLRGDIRLRTLRSLGQLYSALEYWSESIRYYEQWQRESSETDHIVLHGLSYANYQLERYGEALNHWLAYMDLQRENGAEFTRENYAYLNGLYYTLERWDEALETTKEMVLLYNSPTDWENLRAIFRQLDEQNTVAPDADAA